MGGGFEFYLVKRLDEMDNKLTEIDTKINKIMELMILIERVKVQKNEQNDDESSS